MKISTSLFVAISIAVASLVSIAGTPVIERGSLKGVVADPSGAGISNAFVLVHWDPAGSSVGLLTNVGMAQDLVARTDVNGMFSINLPPGFYDVLLSAPAFSPKAKKVRVLPGSTVKYEAKLELDTAVSAALADKFR